jgi:signal transduction histidine kinase
MTDQPLAPASGRLSIFPFATALAALAIFAADAVTPPDCVVAGLYVIVILMAGQFLSGRRLWLAAAGCVGLTVLAQFVAQRPGLRNDEAAYVGAFNTGVSIGAIVVSCHLVLRGRAAEADLRRAQADLAHISRVTIMGELAASIAHEVNQPIAGALANAGACLRWLAGDAPNLEKAREAAARIVRDGERASQIVGRVRQIFVKGDPERAPVNLSQLAHETIDLLSHEAARYAITVQTELAVNLPQVLADRVQVQQVMVNLIVNAIDAMKAVPGTRELVLTSRRSEDGQIWVSVSDTGVGLPPQQAEQMFDAFFTTKPQGTGMGLSISRSIIEAHHGRLWAGPNEAGGAVFLFSLPVSAP